MPTEPAKLFHGDHTTYILKYHIVWITKYRRKKFFEKHQIRCREILAALCLEYEWLIEALDVSPDHTHLYVATEPQDRPSDVVATLKAKSASILRQEFPELRAGKGRIWGRGYFISSVNDKTTSHIIIKYIRNQKSREEALERQLSLFPKPPL